MTDFHPAEQQYRLLFDYNPQPMWVYDVETLEFLTVNDAAVAHYGYSRDEFLRMRVSDIRSAEDVPAFLANVAATRDTAQRSGTWRHRRRDGSSILVDIQSHAIEFDGRRARLVLASDVTERERAIEELRSSNEMYERQYSALVALTRGGILQTRDQEAALRAITETTARTLGVERVGVWRMTPGADAIVLRDLFELSPDRHSSGDVLEAATFPSYFRAISESDVLVVVDAERDARTSEFTESYLRPHGITSMLDAPVLVGGNLAGVLCLENVGNRRAWTAGERSFAMSAANLVSLVLAQQSLNQNRAWLQQILDSEPECVSLVSPEGRLMDMNPAGLRMIEAESRDDVLGSEASAIIHPDDWDAYADLHRRVYRGESGRLQFRINGLRGATRWAETHAAPLRAQDGTVAAMLAVTRDVTEQRRSVEALAASERLNSLVLRSAGEGIHGVDADGFIRFHNPAAATILGYDDAELVGRSAHSVLHDHPVDGSRHAESECPIHQTLQDGEVRRVRHDGFLRKDGSVVPVDYTCSPMTDEAGAVTGVVMNFQDITERLRTEADLRESQRRLRALMDHLPGMAYRGRADDARTMEFVSDGAAELTGYDPDALLESGSIPWTSVIHGEDRANVRERVRRAIETGRPFEIEYRIVTAAGTERWVWERGQAVPVEADGADILEGFIADITRRKEGEAALRESEERFRLLARATSDAIWDWDLPNGTLWWNDGARALYGMTDADGRAAPTLEAWSMRLHPDDRDRVLGSLDALIESGGTSWSAEYRLRREAGAWAHVLDRGHVIRDASGRAIRMIGGISDLTERKQLEDRLQQSQKMESVGRLAGGVAHDFNNLLTVILGTVELTLRDRSNEDRVTADLEEVRRAAERAADLTHQLLAFSRRQVLQPRVLDLNSVISGALSLLRRLIGEDIEIAFAPAADLWPVRADPGQLEQVLVNLAVNARDAMPTGGELHLQTRNVVVDEAFVAMRPTARPGPHVLLAISDTGVGMDADAQEHAFEPFYTTKSVGKGTGLGLATVYGIVQQSGGTIWLYSEIGKGTTFRILLPRADRDAAAESRSTAPAAEGGSETILLVEDEAAVRRLAARVLTTAGYTVLAVASADEALAALDAHNSTVHLLLTDVVMPQMNGPELARRVMEKSPATRVMFMSGYTDDAIVRHGVPAGSTRFLEKPFTIADLTRAVRDAFRD